MMTVYVVQADNCEDYEIFNHWTEGVFASEESAKKYISDEEKRYSADIARIHELGRLRDKRYDDGTYDSFEAYGLTAEEDKEYSEIQDYWTKAGRCCPHYWIEEHEMI